MPPGVEVRELRRAEVVVLVAGTGAAERIGSGRRREGREMDLDGGEMGNCEEREWVGFK